MNLKRPAWKLGRFSPLRQGEPAKQADPGVAVLAVKPSRAQFLDSAALVASRSRTNFGLAFRVEKIKSPKCFPASMSLS